MYVCTMYACNSMTCVHFSLTGQSAIRVDRQGWVCAGFSPEIFVSVVKVYTNVYEARGEKSVIIL